MDHRLKNVLVTQCDYPAQPRSGYDREYCLGLGASMKGHGQKVPVIGYSVGDRFRLIDGGCRLEGARLAGIAELLALDLGKEPTRAELLMAQAAIDIHRQHLPPVDRARLWQSTLQERGCTARELATELGVSDSLVGDYLSLCGLVADLQEQVNRGALHLSKASLIAQQESDPVRQRELAALAKGMGRDAFAAKLRQSRRSEPELSRVKMARVKIPMPDGATIVISGKELGMTEVVQLLNQTLKEARKAAEQYDVKTFQGMMRDKAKRSG
jgi:ParB family transcriptional regulator, chromosome partitioning protein